MFREAIERQILAERGKSCLSSKLICNFTFVTGTEKFLLLRFRVELLFRGFLCTPHSCVCFEFKPKKAELLVHVFGVSTEEFLPFSSVCVVPCRGETNFMHERKRVEEKKRIFAGRTKKTSFGESQCLQSVDEDEESRMKRVGSSPLLGNYSH